VEELKEEEDVDADMNSKIVESIEAACRDFNLFEKASAKQGDKKVLIKHVPNIQPAYWIQNN